MSTAPTTRQQVYELLTGDDEGRICKDIPESACNDQPRHFLIHVLALAATKLGDGLSDPKLVLSWLIQALGAPAALVALLVPIREAGALLPQLVIAAAIRRQPRRKWIWVAGSVIQGLCVLAMAGVALLMQGLAAGILILLLLAVFSLARSLCSVAYKDVLGKTVSKSTRGTATGSAKTLAAAGVVLIGLALVSGLVGNSVQSLALMLLLAGCCWLAGAALFAGLHEEAGASEGGGNALSLARQQLALLWQDRPLQCFILVRALLMATALGTPFMLTLLPQSQSQALDNLGLFVLASALAALCSSYVWGRLADRSSRRVLILSGLLGALALASAAALAATASPWLEQRLLLPTLVFMLMIAHQGVRLGRATHLVDMAQAEQRASYTALANTVIGIALMASGLLGLLASWLGIAVVIGLLAMLCLLGSLLARQLDEVQQA